MTLYGIEERWKGMFFGGYVSFQKVVQVFSSEDRMKAVEKYRELCDKYRELNEYRIVHLFSFNSGHMDFKTTIEIKEIYKR